MKLLKTLLPFAFATLAASAAAAETMKMSVTTSFANSGLAEVLLPEIEKDTGITVELLVVGTGQALELGANGDVDAVLVHSRAAEEKWLAAGNGTHRREIMYNDFVVIGPASDPAGARSAEKAADAFADIANAQAAFVSRGDDSGTHKAELKLWSAAGIEPSGDWYKAVGQGMGAALNTAAGLDAYILSDRATWLSFENKAGLELVFEGDPALFNQYAYLPVNAEKYPSVNAAAAEKLEAWLTSDKAKGLIDGYQIAGQQLFHFNAVAE
ncbi:substrate-binding domain-containing protein [Albidovulum sediminicola]|uniref:Substrate-binding domain-containing protein n=1 Tax=Albidovulum sediminicola TaxID=2984331 RepID=A0ABT2Z053_9RHOB|nr:substrate-binding domain-containing protein [Defluviimonas sp. WL0075]MCV2864533.1 substrate-binding domain-containing protein [Defluviimonas sp. WL0075]